MTKRTVALALALVLGTALPNFALAEETMKVTQTICNEFSNVCTHTQTVFRLDTRNNQWIVVSVTSWTTQFRPKQAEQ